MTPGEEMLKEYGYERNSSYKNEVCESIDYKIPFDEDTSYESYIVFSKFKGKEWTARAFDSGFGETFATSINWKLTHAIGMRLVELNEWGAS